MKKLFITCILFNFSIFLFSQTSQQRFIKGNISEKTEAVKNSTDDDVIWLSTHAVSFVIDNYQYLGEDRELEALSLAAILSLPNDFGANASEQEKNTISQNLLTIYNSFNKSSNVKIAVISKYMGMKNFISIEPLTQILNQDISTNIQTISDVSLSKAIINTLAQIGNETSFQIFYEFYYKNTLKESETELVNAISSLIPKSMDTVLKLITSKNINHIETVYEIINKNSKISQNCISEIAENLLNEAILLMSNSTESKTNLVKIQLGSLRILYENKCTRASESVLSYFNVAKKEFKENAITENQFIDVIGAIGNLAPIDSVSTLITYLEELNRQKENGESVSSSVVTAVIKTLGAIGDKSAFDSLLAVTYLNYPDSVLTAAREALSGLKW